MRKRVEQRGARPLFVGGVACAALAAVLVAASAAFSAPWAASQPASQTVTSSPSANASVNAAATPVALNAETTGLASPLENLSGSLFGSVAYASSTDEKKNGSFTVGGLTYTITEVASEGAAGKVDVTSADKSLVGQVEIPAEVAHTTSGNAYQVTGLRFVAFENRTGISAVRIPASVTKYIFNGDSKACFVGCTNLAQITVDEGNPSLAAQDGVLYAKGANGSLLSLLSYPQAKVNLETFTVPETVSTVAGKAFAGNTALKYVVFTAGLEGSQSDYQLGGTSQMAFVGGLGASAFANCTALESVEFPTGAKLGTLSGSKDSCIGSYAFQNCISLKSIRIPVLVGAAQKANAYNSFEELNPGSTLTVGTTDTFTSGFAPYWHDEDGPVARLGIGGGAFNGCTNLSSVVFEAGGNSGAFAYWAGSYLQFYGCTNLTSLVFESQQAYWGNTSGSMVNGSYTNMWADKAGATFASPTYYYAVDYYATAADAAAADKAGSTRLARVEYAHGTSTAAIATSAQTLAESMVSRTLYAETPADGVVPNANAVAQAAGLGAGDWVWKLTGTQSKREGLSDPCQAYLVNLNDISAGRLASAHIMALYLACDRNLSEGTVADTAFDAQRYVNDSAYQIKALDGETSPYFTYNRTAGELVEGFSVCAADGTVLGSNTYTATYQRYNSETKQFEAASLADGSGAYLVTITPTAESGYVGTLQEWIVTKNLSGAVSEEYGEGPADTANKSRHAYSQTETLDFGSAPYCVTVGSGDVVGALVASGYAGLVQGAVNASSDTSTTYGFSINSSLSTGEASSSGAAVAFSRVDSSHEGKEMAPSAYANACFSSFENRRTNLGATSSKYPWGSTAVLVPATHASALVSASAYAYANKAPVFFTEIDGSVGAGTLANLKKFENVVVMGSESQFSAANYQSLANSLGSIGLARLQGSTTSMGAFAEAVAANLVTSGKASWKNVAVVDGTNPVDAVAALTFTGHEGGVTLIAKSTADAKEALTNMHSNAATVATVALYGRPSSNTTALSSSAWDGNAFGAIWEDEASFLDVLANITSALNKYPDKDDSYNVATGDDNTNNGNTGDNNNGNNNNGNNGNNGNTDGNNSNNNNNNNNGGNTGGDGGDGNQGGSGSGGNDGDGGNNQGDGDGGQGGGQGGSTPHIEVYEGHIAAYTGAGSGRTVAHTDKNGLVVVESWDVATAAAGGTAAARSGSVAAGGGDGVYLDEVSDATTASLSSNGTGLAAGEADYSGIEEETPLPVRAGYMGGLLLLCGSVVPLLRRCK